MKRFSTAAIAMTCVAVLASIGSAQNLLLNPEFVYNITNPILPSPAPSDQHEVAQGWQKSEPSVNMAGSPMDTFRFQKSGFAERTGNSPNTPPTSPGPDGNPATNDIGGAWFRPAERNNATNPGVLADASFWQDVATGPGLYRLSFWEKHEFFAQAQKLAVEMEYYMGGSGGTSLAIESFDLLDATLSPPSPTAENPAQFYLRSRLGTAPTGTDTIRVRGVMLGGSDAGSNPLSIILDGFDLRIVPEPGAITLALLGVLGLVFRRRTR